MSTAAATWIAQSAVTVSSDLEPQNMVRQLVRTQGNITINKTEEKKAQNSAILYTHKHIYHAYIYWMCIYIYMHSCLYTKMQKLPAVFFFSMYIGCTYVYIHTQIHVCI